MISRKNSIVQTEKIPRSANRKSIIISSKHPKRQSIMAQEETNIYERDSENKKTLLTYMSSHLRDKPHQFLN